MRTGEGEPGREVRIVRAEPEQAEALSHIAQVAKAHWGYPAAWLEAWRVLLTVPMVEIVANDYFVAEAGGQPVGFCAVYGCADEWYLWHLWVLPMWQGRGIGRQLFHRAAVCVREGGGGWFDIRSDPHAESFYLRMGAVRIGEVDATISGIPRVLPELRYVLP